MTFYTSHDFFFVCICKQISDIESKMGRRGKELSNDIVKEIAQKLFEAGKIIDYVSNTLHIPRSTVGSYKSVLNNGARWKTSPEEEDPFGYSKGL